MREKIMYFVRHWKPTDEPSLLLYVIAFFYTIFLAAVVVADTIYSDFNTPDPLLQFYYTLVPIYIGVKMVERCLQRKWKERSGEMLVLLWFCIFFVIVILHCLTKGRIEIPSALTYTVIFVILSFYGSLGLKAFYEKKMKKLTEQISNKGSPNFRKKRRMATKTAI